MRAGLVVGLFVALAGAADACSIPVFRYALDRWPADKYQLEVSATDAQDEAVARFLRNFTDSAPVNLEPIRSKEEGASRLVFPHAAPGTELAWSGTLDGAALTAIADSPARAELVRRILDGEVGVWLLVESGRREVDDAAAATLEKRLGYLTQVAVLPHIDPTDPSSKLGPGPALRVGFSLLRVRPDDAAEQPFLKLLAGPKGAPPDGPWFALVFGRGRVLGAWPAAGFGDEQIDEACLFLLGACSCQVKRMNPGWDLLLNADWNEKLQAIGFPAAAAAAAAPDSKAPIVETVTIAPESEPVMTGSTQIVISNNLLYGVAGTLLVLGGGLIWWTMGRKP